MTKLIIEDKIDINETTISATVFNLEESIQKDMHSMSDQRIDLQTKSGKIKYVCTLSSESLDDQRQLLKWSFHTVQFLCH